jgi:hypothetical protein
MREVRHRVRFGRRGIAISRNANAIRKAFALSLDTDTHVEVLDEGETDR